MRSYYLDIDASEVIRLANELAEHVGQEKAQKILDRTLWKTTKQIKTPIAKALHSVYTAPSGWIKSGFLNPIMGPGECIIPLSGYKGKFGKVFRRMGTYKNISVEIVRGQKTALPKEMKHQGGNPPFRLGGGVATISASGGKPSVVGIALPQMPMPAAKGNKPTEAVIEEKMISIMDRACHEILGGYVK